MAKRKTKNEQIEELQERIKTLEREKSVHLFFDNLSKKKRVLLSLFLVLVVIALCLIFVIAFTKASAITPLNEEDYGFILAMVNGREWVVSDKTLSVLKEVIPSATGEITTAVRGHSLELCIRLLAGEIDLHFIFHPGTISSLFSGLETKLIYSETKLGKGKTLTLLFGERKAVFKEKR